MEDDVGVKFEDGLLPDHHPCDPGVGYRCIQETDISLNTNQIQTVGALNMRLEWPVYAFTAGVFLSFALSVQYLSLGTGAVVGLFVLLTVPSDSMR